MPELPNLTVPSDLVAPAVMALAAATFLWLAFRIFHGQSQRRKKAAEETPRKIDLADFQMGPVPREGPQLEMYHVPVRLVLVVMAAPGRETQLPNRELWPGILDRAVPGIGHVISAHDPELQPWPAQLSVTGFTRKFFDHLSLPNERGKGSPWSAAAGRFSAMHHRYLVGLLVRAEDANSLGQFSVERDSQWLDIFRIDLREAH